MPTYTTVGQSSYTIPTTGIYKIECHGAGGGGPTGSNADAYGDTVTYGGGKGGKTIYHADLTAGDTLWIWVGGTGTTSAGGSNGGGKPGNGSSTNKAYGGGGASHAATASGTLKTLAAVSKVLCIAGGGGGSGGGGGIYNDLNSSSVKHGVGGKGGGSSGGAGTFAYSGADTAGQGGTSSKPGAANCPYSSTSSQAAVKGGFGYGGAGVGVQPEDGFPGYTEDDYYISESDPTNCGGGGGGKFGGGGGYGYFVSVGGGGGSGYIKSATTTSKLGTSFANSTSAGGGAAANTNGKVIVTLVEEASTPPTAPTKLSINSKANKYAYLRWSGHKNGTGNTIEKFTITIYTANNSSFSGASTVTKTSTSASYNFDISSYAVGTYFRYKIKCHGSGGDTAETSSYSSACQKIAIDSSNKLTSKFITDCKTVLDTVYPVLKGTTKTITAPSAGTKITKTHVQQLADGVNDCRGTSITFNTTKPNEADKTSLLNYL